jgi:hypothetical protein
MSLLLKLCVLEAGTQKIEECRKNTKMSIRSSLMRVITKQSTNTQINRFLETNDSADEKNIMKLFIMFYTDLFLLLLPMGLFF